MRWIALMFALCVCASGVATAQPSRRDTRAAAEQPFVSESLRAVRNGPFGARRIVMGMNKCFDSAQGLPNVNASPWGTLLILWSCHGRDNQIVRLEDGVLFVGVGRTHQIIPTGRPGGESCDTYPWSSELRRYELGICVVANATPGLNTDLSVPDLLPMVGVSPPRALGPVLGAPLRVVPIADDRPPQSIWEFDRRSRQLRVSGTDLCITPPSQDMTNGVPLILDSCEAPFQIDPEDRSDGPSRSRAFAEREWW
ncbi:MAG: hypothetical protein GC189_05325 [Alphaproteobacteria bacterium]|nr:hypothetical protein [Alphaproteobacteria bacterium]